MGKLGDLLNKYPTCLTEKELDSVKNLDWHSSEFYGLPKVHKCQSIIDAMINSTDDVVNVLDPPDLKGRPIGCWLSDPLAVSVNLLGLEAIELNQSS